MKQQKEHWVKTLFSFAGPCKGKMTLSVLCAILSVAGGFVPVSYTHLDVYKRQR